MKGVDHEEAGRRTRLARERIGLTIAEAARRTGLSAATVRRHERTWGRYTQSRYALAEGYGVSLRWLLGEGPREPVQVMPAAAPSDQVSTTSTTSPRPVPAAAPRPDEAALVREAEGVMLGFIRGQLRLLRVAGVSEGNDYVASLERARGRFERRLAASPAEAAERRRGLEVIPGGVSG